jgi:hypothetical protein
VGCCVYFWIGPKYFWLLRRDKKIHARVVVFVDDKARGWWSYEEIGTLLRFLEYIILRVLFVPAFHVFIYGG